MKINRGSVLVIGLALLAFMTAAEASAQVKWKGTVVKEGGVTVVRNPKEPLYKTLVLELKEDLSLGGPEAQGDYAFSQIRTFIVDDAGSIYVLDQQSSHVKVFDASGKYLRTIGRQGQGPGELDRPRMLSINRVRGEISVLELSRRMSFFKLDGTFLRHVSFKEIWALYGHVDSKGHIYVTEGIVEEKDPRYEVKMLGPDASLIAMLARSPAPVRHGGRLTAFTAIGYFVVDGDDHLVYGYPLTYEIQYFGPASPELFKKVTREYDPVAITEEEKREREKDVQPNSGLVLDFPKYHAAYYRFFLSDLGHVFVQTWEKTKDGKSIHDIFDAEGRFIGRVPLKPSGVEILKGKYYALEEDEDGYQTVKRYAVTWTVK
ncbi:MAG: 6-bladed beta-propeller [Acidobacteria bacterium]|nr:6-bladed beta-propeller [Acidobacteriota bacterium]